MPDLDEKLAGHGRDGGVAIAFAGEEFPTPFSQRRVPAHAQDSLRTLDKKVPHVSAPAFADAEFDVFPVPALALTGIASDVSHELLGAVKAPHVSDDRQQGEGVDLSNSQQLHAAQHQRFGADLLTDEAQQARARFGLVVEAGKVSGEQFPLQRRPVTLGEDPLPRAFELKSPASRTDGELVEVAFERVESGGVVGHRILVGMEEFPAFAGLAVGDPNAWGIAGQVDQCDATAAILSLSA